MSNEKRTKGEGDRGSARRYNEAAHATADSGEVEAHEEERRRSDDPTLRRAEREGREKAKERDPEVVRDYGKAS